MNDYQKYLDAEHIINEGLIRRDVSASRPEGYTKVPQDRMDTMARFLEGCGNPQANIPAIHVTGTSGKGSVCALIAAQLQNRGLKVGLHISPYLQSATEKIWIDGRYCSASMFADLVDWVEPVARSFLSPQTPASIHGMASVAIALEAFRREEVDVMVFEAGCGGRFDLTSFVDTRVAVITNVGMDHIVSLGPTLEDIAWHKAGIARPGKPIISGADGSPAAIIEKEANELECELLQVPRESPAKHNFRLATTAVDAFLGRATEPMPPPSAPILPGRCERIPDRTRAVFLDGAHNAEKLRVAVDNALSAHEKGPRIAVVGLLGTKASRETVAPLHGRFDRIITTTPRVYGKEACPATDTATLVSSEGCHVEVIEDPMRAVNRALEIEEGTILITGSFYLCGELRERWFPKEQVVLGRTSWPDR